MLKWQRTARLTAAIAAVAFAVVLVSALKRRAPIPVQTPVTRTDPKAIVEGASGRTFRLNREHEEIRIDHERVLTYPNGATKLVGVTVVTERAGGRMFTIKAKEGQVGEHESNIVLEGSVQITASDGMLLTTDRATYSEPDGILRAPGSASCTTSGRMSSLFSIGPSSRWSLTRSATGAFT